MSYLEIFKYIVILIMTGTTLYLYNQGKQTGELKEHVSYLQNVIADQVKTINQLKDINELENQSLDEYQQKAQNLEKKISDILESLPKKSKKLSPELQNVISKLRNLSNE